MSEAFTVKKMLKKTAKDEVFISEKNGLDIVVKKIRHGGDIESSKKSYELIRGLNHPQIPKVLNVKIEEEHVIIEREHVAGRSLEEIADWMGPIALETVVRWWEEMLKITMYIHGLKVPIIHRDIKPSNIIMGSDGYLYLIDFGIAKVVHMDRTSDTTLVGTMGYAAPEQFGYGQSDERTDLYNLTRTIQRLLIGVPPSHRQFNTLWDEKKKQLPKGIVKIIEKGIEFNSSERFKSSEEMLKALVLFKKNDNRDQLINYRSFAMVVLPTMVLLMFSIILNGALFSRIRTTENQLANLPINSSNEVVFNLNDNEFGDPHFEEMIKGYFDRYQLTYSIEALRDIDNICIIGDQIIKADDVDRIFWDGNQVTITTKDRESIGSMGKLSTLYDMRLFPNVKTLYILNQAVGSFEGLKYNNLETLICQNSQLTSIRGIQNMTNLTYLDFSHNAVDNIKELTHLDQLIQVIGKDNDLSNMDGLEHAIYIETLDLSNNLMSDASVLSELKYLTTLNLSKNYMTSISIGQAKQLEVLDLSNNFLQEIDGLENLNNLILLDVKGNELDKETMQLVDSFGERIVR